MARAKKTSGQTPAKRRPAARKAGRKVEPTSEVAAPPVVAPTALAQTASPVTDELPVLFPVSVIKLVLMSTVTLNLYSIYWFYKQWKYLQPRLKDQEIMPFWRAFFAPIFCFSCFKKIKEVAQENGVPSSFSAGWLALLWVALTVSARLPHSYMLLCFFSPFALVPVQDLANRLNAKVAPRHDPNSRYSVWNVLGIIWGSLLVLAVIIGSFLPPHP